MQSDRPWLQNGNRDSAAPLFPELSNLKNLIGTESVLAECSGLNYSVYVTESRLLVGKRFALGESYVNVPHSNVSTLELITKSILPPLTFAVIAAIGAFLVWWFPGQARLTLPSSPYNFVIIGLAGLFLVSLVASWWRKRVAVLRIGIVGSHEPITVKVVSTSKAEGVFRALKG